MSDTPEQRLALRFYRDFYNGGGRGVDIIDFSDSLPDDEKEAFEKICCDVISRSIGKTP